MTKITRPQYYILQALFEKVQRNLRENEQLKKLAQELSFLDDASFLEIEEIFYIDDDYDFDEELKKAKIEVEK